MVALYEEPKEELTDLQKQILEEREEVANKPGNKPLSWCSVHDAKLGTCFPMHHTEDVPVLPNTDFKEYLRKRLNDGFNDRFWSEENYPKGEI